MVHDEPARAGGRFDLRHGGHDPALATRGQAMRLRRPQVRPLGQKAVDSLGTTSAYVPGPILLAPFRILIRPTPEKVSSEVPQDSSRTHRGSLR